MELFERVWFSVNLMVVLSVVAPISANDLKLDNAKFVRIGASISGSCNVSDTNQLQISEEFCGSSPTTSPTLEQQGFEVNNAAGTGNSFFRLGESTFKQYNIRCGIDCDSVVSYQIEITDHGPPRDDGTGNILICELKFTNDKGGTSYTKPDKATWLKNGVEVKSQTFKDVDFTNNGLNTTVGTSLSLESLTNGEEDASYAGVYFCQFHYKDEIMSEEYAMEGELQVKVEFSPFKCQYSDDQDVIVSCQVRGFPIRSIHWFRDGAFYADSIITTKVHAHFTESSFTLNTIEDEVDRGTYECVATNDNTTVSASKILHIRDKLAPVWPLVGILVQVVVLVIFILLGERLRKKQLGHKMQTQGVPSKMS